MVINSFPGTQVTAELINPRVSQYCDIFYRNANDAQGVVMASVNAGTSYSGSLFEVGQEGMTGAFYGILSAQQNFVGRHPYQKVHKLLHRLSGNKDIFTLDDFDYESPMQFSLISKPSDHSSCIDYDGIVFIDIFKEELRPNQIAANYAMIYVVPPLGDLYSSQNDFLRAIEATAENIIKAVMTYNKNYTKENSPNGRNLKLINTIRVCLFSGGYFNTFQLNPDRIASYIYQGIVNELHSKETSITTIQFENNYYDVMENEIKSKKQDFDIVPTLMKH
ncbi:MAG: hypothetical protein ACJAS3_002238 [Roseivirga sp.]|jgi:hypothetical protein